MTRIVRDADLNEARLTEIERTVKIAWGEYVTTEFEFPEEIAVYDSGKYRYAICETDEP